MKYGLLLLFLVGCGIQLPVPQQQVIVSVPQVNTTNTTVVEQPIFYFPSNMTNTTYFIGEEGSMVVIADNRAFIIDGGFTPLTVLNHYNVDLWGIVVTLDVPEKSRQVKNLVFGYKPKVIFDNGFRTPERDNYLKYATEFGVTSVILNTDRVTSFDSQNVIFFVPYENGFFTTKAENSIVVQVGDVLYMGNCYKGNCENTVNTVAKKVVLANMGKCPTNTFDFIQQVGATDIYGTELCQDFLKDAWLDDISQLEKLGIRFHKVNGMEVIE